ncbi:DUF1365 domain-containing protein [Chachezhania sediminis]|uniref:DUF1365 domain-containing protein n=1 Tax=Chachezhania sediminis TaxID=2599291 RepID=UPI00131ACEFD|nr:DUF1365 domain-containing protein [Chachezhania sediminis]
MRPSVEHISGTTWHGRRGAIRNGFSYHVDMLCIDPEDPWPRGPLGYARNRRAPLAIHDRNHGGPPGHGMGATWVRRVLAQRQIPSPDRIELLTQPTVLGYVFNPVSFWLCYRDVALTAVIAEVTNTFGERHSYLCHRPDHGPIMASDKLEARKVFYVSPFQPVDGTYVFRFAIDPDRIAIRIDYRVDGEAEKGDGEGLIATLTGERRALNWLRVMGILLRRPLGSRWVMGLIHWQALKLWWKGARYRDRGAPPDSDVTTTRAMR